jgi:hypothetical protein
MSEGLNAINKFARDTLKELLAQCTEAQQAFFLRLYPDGPDKMPQEKIPRAIEQCEATIKKNKAKVEEVKPT